MKYVIFYKVKSNLQKSKVGNGEQVCSFKIGKTSTEKETFEGRRKGEKILNLCNCMG